MSVPHIISIIFIVILIYYLVLTVWYTVLLIGSFPQVLKKFMETKYGHILEFIERDHIIPITIIIPVFNMADKILNTLYSILDSQYKNVKIILVNDGSTDNMMELIKKEFLLYEIPLVIKRTIKTSNILHIYQSKSYPNMMVIDKEHHDSNTSADALNAGLNACQSPLVITMDADTIIEPESISRMLFGFLSKNHCITVSGSVYVLNENKSKHGRLLETKLPSHFIPAVQSVEYLRSFLYGRVGLNSFGGALCYPGAFTLFETEILRNVEGFDVPNFANDAEITIKIHHWMRHHKYPYCMQHTPNSFCWTEVPSTFKSYWKQRGYWQRGMWRSVLRHIGMFLNPLYGIVGLLTFPFFILFEVMGPIVECISFILLLIGLYYNLIELNVLLWFLFLAWGFITFISISMVFLNAISFNKYHRRSDTLRVTALIFLEMLWFRQARAICCTIATVRYFINRLLGRAI